MASESSTILFLCSGNYYRSRFAELLFNHLAPLSALAHRADSAGLWPNCSSHNPGPMSQHTLAALQSRGVKLPNLHRTPRDVTERDIRDAALIIALKEAEHRPILRARFPNLLPLVEFWHVHDLDAAPPSEAIALIEINVARLVERLARSAALQSAQ